MNAKAQAQKTANYFLRGDDYIAKHNRSFDSLWEQGNGDAVAEEFARLYNSDPEVRRLTEHSRFFSQAMITPKREGK